MKGPRTTLTLSSNWWGGRIRAYMVSKRQPTTLPAMKIQKSFS